MPRQTKVDTEQEQREKLKALISRGKEFIRNGGEVEEGSDSSSDIEEEKPPVKKSKTPVVKKSKPPVVKKKKPSVSSDSSSDGEFPVKNPKKEPKVENVVSKEEIKRISKREEIRLLKERLDEIGMTMKEFREFTSSLPNHKKEIETNISKVKSLNDNFIRDARSRMLIRFAE